jgi:ABC-type Na+ efflux pump permease subunit
MFQFGRKIASDNEATPPQPPSAADESANAQTDSNVSAAPKVPAAQAPAAQAAAAQAPAAQAPAARAPVAQAPERKARASTVSATDIIRDQILTRIEPAVAVRLTKHELTARVDELVAEIANAQRLLLNQAEQRIQKLTRDAAGKPVTEPFGGEDEEEGGGQLPF